MVKIGIVSTGDSWPKEFFFSRYWAAVRRAGAQPVRIGWKQGLTEPQAQQLLRRCDGFLFTGGGDPDPAYYGQKMLPACHTPVPARDKAELLLLQLLLPTRKPIFGVCRGCQMLAVAAGGSMLQDITSQRPEGDAEHHSDNEHRFAPSHPAHVVAGSRLHQLLGCAELLTNSVHHQAVETPGQGLAVCARSPMGVVEAIEGTDPGRFILGTQWHPEATAAADPLQQGLFDAFVQACR